MLGTPTATPILQSMVGRSLRAYGPVSGEDCFPRVMCPQVIPFRCALHEFAITQHTCFWPQPKKQSSSSKLELNLRVEPCCPVLSPGQQSPASNPLYGAFGSAPPRSNNQHPPTYDWRCFPGSTCYKLAILSTRDRPEFASLKHPSHPAVA